MARINPIPGFSEPFNSWSHLIGAGVCVVCSWPLLRRGGHDRIRVLALAVFVFACVLVLSMSGVYHLLEPGTGARAVLRRLDHAAIFLLIAGTFTPIHAIMFRGIWRWGILVFVWVAAITGIVLKSVFFDSVPPWLGVLIYVLFGWFGLVSAIKVARSFGLRFIAPLVYGAVAYTAGAGTLGLLYMLGDPMLIPGVVGRHEIFHVAVLAGVAFHWQFIYRIADGTCQCPAPHRQ